MCANEQVYRALEEQRAATEGSPDPLPAANAGGFPRAEFFTSAMPRLPPGLASPSPYGGGADGGGGGSVSGGGGGIAAEGGGDGGGGGGGATAVEAERAVNVLAMEQLGDNLMTLSQVS